MNEECGCITLTALAIDHLIANAAPGKTIGSISVVQGSGQQTALLKDARTLPKSAHMYNTESTETGISSPCVPRITI